MTAVTDPWEYALCTVDEARGFCGLAGSGHDDKLQTAINEASRMIEAEYGGPVHSRGTIVAPLVEYFQAGNRYFNGVLSDLVVNDWPLHSVSAVYEGGTGATGTGTLLVANTDYRVITVSLDPVPFRVIRRLSGGLPVAWPQISSTASYRHVEVRYLAGYKRAEITDAVNDVPLFPDGILRVLRELVQWIYRQRDKKETGLSSVSDALGNRSFSGPAYITDQMRATLRAAGAMVGQRYSCGERD